MDECDGDVIMTEPQWQRLWEKSAIGTRLEGGGLKLFPEEVIFAHIHRHQSLPHDYWINEKITYNHDTSPFNIKSILAAQIKSFSVKASIDVVV